MPFILPFIKSMGAARANINIRGALIPPGAQMELPEFKTTAEIKVPESSIDQVIGQEEAVEIIRKAADQKRFVLLLGDPGTGKSMLGQAMAELLPVEKLEDILIFPNPRDKNYPLVKTAKAGEG